MRRTLFAVVAATILSFVAPVAYADLILPWLSYRTGPYSPSGIPPADGFLDFITLLNERDGGIGGVPVRVVDCETGYSTERGVECYESTKGEDTLAYMPLSTGITYQLIPRATADGIPIHSMGYGRTAAANGKIFPWIFNFPANYWDGASIAIKHIMDLNDGDISGMKIGLVYHNSPYGKEPIRTLEVLAEKHDYELMLIPVDHPGQEQKSQWLEIRRAQPDYLLMWGWGVMNAVAIQEAANIRFPMENFIGVWWSGSENDVLPVGERAHNYKALALHASDTDYPLFDDIRKYVFDTGKNAGDGSSFGHALYNRGVYNSFLLAEAIRVAQEMHGVADITREMMRDGLENLNMSEERMAELGLPNYGAAFQVTCENHGGPGIGWVSQWDANEQKWNIITDAIQSDREVIDPLILADSEAFAKENGITPVEC